MAGETIIADPELRSTKNGRSVAGFTIASTPRTFDRQSNQWTDGDALFLRCTVWGDLAEHCARSLAKGMRVIAQGRLTQHSWEDEQHQKRSSMELPCRRVIRAEPPLRCRRPTRGVRLRVRRHRSVISASRNRNLISKDES